MNGKTIEIHNTDAEGRLVLADVLHLAITEYKPDIVVDIATLTGAVLFALGCVGSAVMTNDASTAEHVMRAGEEGGEPLWQLPLWPELEKEVKSDIADLKNIAKGNVKGGTIIGGMFLKEFVGDAKWVHLDIAGTGWNCQALGYPAAGGSAFGMRTLINTAELFKR
jgi:leucyl aminopeptidase